MWHAYCQFLEVKWPANRRLQAHSCFQGAQVLAEGVLTAALLLRAASLYACPDDAQIAADVMIANGELMSRAATLSNSVAIWLVNM